MADTLDPKDLSRFQIAQKEAHAADQRASEAQRAAAEAQAHAIAARGALDFQRRQIAADQSYALTATDSVNLETGVITRGPRPEQAAEQG